MPLDQQSTQEEDEGAGRLGVMSFGAHLDELRVRLIKAAIVPVVLVIAVFFLADYVRDWLTWPLLKALQASGQPAHLQVLNPNETLMVNVQLAIWASVIVSAPWILWQFWLFVRPGLFSHEQRFARFLVPLSALLVTAGVSGFFLALPMMLQVLIGFGLQEAPTVANASQAPAALVGGAQVPVLDKDPESARPGEMWMRRSDSQIYIAVDKGRPDGRLELRTISVDTTGSLTQQYRLQEYIDFVLWFSLAIAIAFQMPLVVLLLGWIGLIDVKTLRKYRRHAFFVCAIAAAIITPTVDMFSMFLLLVPLYGLYELGILLLVIAPTQAVAEGGVMRNALGTLIGRPKYKPKRSDGDEGDEEGA